MKSRLSAKRRFYGIVLRCCIILCACLTVALVVSIIGYVLYQGLGHVTWEFLSTQRSAMRNTIGIFPNIIFTLYLVLTTLAIAIPLGIGAAIYLNEYAKNRKLVRTIEFATETLTGIPSIIFGLVGYLFIVQQLGVGTGILAGSITLAIVVLPTIVRTTQEALKTVPVSYREGAVALGATKWYMLRTLVLPSSRDGIIGGVILSVGRMVGESAALILTAGMGFRLVTNYFQALQTSGATLTVALYQYVMDQGEFEVGFAIAAILMIIVLVINFAVKLTKKRLKKG